jgi:hypothetical protein
MVKYTLNHPLSSLTSPPISMLYIRSNGYPHVAPKWWHHMSATWHHPLAISEDFLSSLYRSIFWEKIFSKFYSTSLLKVVVYIPRYLHHPLAISEDFLSSLCRSIFWEKIFSKFQSTSSSKSRGLYSGLFILVMIVCNLTHLYAPSWVNKYEWFIFITYPLKNYHKIQSLSINTNKYSRKESI